MGTDSPHHDEHHGMLTHRVAGVPVWLLLALAAAIPFLIGALLSVDRGATRAADRAADPAPYGFALASVDAELAALFAGQDAPAAVVVKVTGDVSTRSGDADPVPAGVGARLAEGDQLIPASGAEATVVSRAGRKQVVTQPVTILAPEGADRGSVFAQTIDVLAQAATSDARTVPNRQGMIRPIPGEPTPMRPKNGIRVKPGGQVTFEWAPVEGATGYMVQVRRAGAPPVRHEAEGTSLTLDISDLDLGHMYYWTVGAGRRVAREDSMYVPSLAEYDTFSGTLAAIVAAGFDPDDDGRLLNVMAHTDFGFLYDALDVIAQIESTGAPLSADLLLLKGELLDEMGRLDEAQAAFDAADRAMAMDAPASESPVQLAALGRR